MLIALEKNALQHFSMTIVLLAVFFLNVFNFILAVGSVLSTSEEENNELKLVPSVNEVVHFENESYIVACQGVNTRLRWLDPDNVWIDKGRGGVHVEERDNELVLMFSSISSQTDNGTWTCQAENGNRKTAFNMIVYSMIKTTFTWI